MGKNYTIFLILLTINGGFLFGQSCPTINGNLQPDIYAMQFNIGSLLTTNAIDYPNTIQILASNGVDYITYTKGQVFNNGIDNFIQYENPSPQPWTGVKIDYNNFQINFGLPAGTCTFINGLLSSNDFNLENRVKLFPNPINQNDVLEIDISGFESVLITIYDGLGKKVYNTTKSNNFINTSSFSKGIYIVKINISNNTITKKLIVM